MKLFKKDDERFDQALRDATLRRALVAEFSRKRQSAFLMAIFLAVLAVCGFMFPPTQAFSIFVLFQAAVSFAISFKFEHDMRLLIISEHRQGHESGASQLHASERSRSP